MAEETGQVTGTKDKNYNLIWYVEQCLNNVLKMEEYAGDAERDGDNDLGTSSAAPSRRASAAPNRARSCSSRSSTPELDLCGGAASRTAPPRGPAPQRTGRPGAKVCRGR